MKKVKFLILSCFLALVLLASCTPNKETTKVTQQETVERDCVLLYPKDNSNAEKKAMNAEQKKIFYDLLDKLKEEKVMSQRPGDFNPTYSLRTDDHYKALDFMIEQNELIIARHAANDTAYYKLDKNSAFSQSLFKLIGEIAPEAVPQS